MCLVIVVHFLPVVGVFGSRCFVYPGGYFLFVVSDKDGINIPACMRGGINNELSGRG